MKLFFFSIITRLYGIFRLPAMTFKEIKIFKRALLSFVSNDCINIFEYGTGFSTIYFARFLKRKRMTFHIYSVDNNLEWHEKIKRIAKLKGLDDCISLSLFEFEPFWRKTDWNWRNSPQCGQFAPKSQAELDYIKIPSFYKNKFNFVSVDGRFRRRCLEYIINHLATNAIVFLHDAQKPNYRMSLKYYKYSIMLDSGTYFPFLKGKWKMWMGSLDNSFLNNIWQK